MIIDRRGIEIPVDGITADSDIEPSAGLAIKEACRVATTANITLNGEQTIDGVAAVAGNRVLVKSQTDQTQNGIYVVSTGNWARSADFNQTGEIVSGTQVLVTLGTVNATKTFYVTSANPITIDVSNIVFGSLAAQPLDSDLTAIAALTTTSYGRSLLTLASATALAAEVDSFFLTPAEGNAAYQPLDSDLTAIAALSTTSYGRAFLALADAAAARTAVGLGNVDNTSDATKNAAAVTLTNKTLDSAGAGNVLKVSGVTVSAGQYPGEPSTGTATAGNVGEYIESVIAQGSAVSLVTNTAKTLTSISLPAGDWDVSSVIYFLTAATTNVTRFINSISGTTNTLDTTAGKLSDNSYPAYVPGLVGQSSVVAPYRISLSSTTTIFVVGFSTFTVSTMTMYGMIRARRVR